MADNDVLQSPLEKRGTETKRETNNTSKARKQGTNPQIPNFYKLCDSNKYVKKYYQSNLNNYIFLKRGKGERNLKAIQYKSLREPYLQKEKGKIPFLKRGLSKVV